MDIGIVGVIDSFCIMMLAYLSTGEVFTRRWLAWWFFGVVLVGMLRFA